MNSNTHVKISIPIIVQTKGRQWSAAGYWKWEGGAPKQQNKYTVSLGSEKCISEGKPRQARCRTWPGWKDKQMVSGAGCKNGSAEYLHWSRTGWLSCWGMFVSGKGVKQKVRARSTNCRVEQGEEAAKPGCARGNTQHNDHPNLCYITSEDEVCL